MSLWSYRKPIKSGQICSALTYYGWWKLHLSDNKRHHSLRLNFYWGIVWPLLAALIQSRSQGIHVILSPMDLQLYS
ncbi:hypothetical protein BJX63DRAFT_139228 [Aspergillus granulosus]|uniref:Uncharacterized protein n=1 Tax=Aspergillus granulosus TaxID=176169 RepID=A0ABR4HM43_9EURO